MKSKKEVRIEFERISKHEILRVKYKIKIRNLRVKISVAVMWL